MKSTEDARRTNNSRLIQSEKYWLEVGERLGAFLNYLKQVLTHSDAIRISDIHQNNELRVFGNSEEKQ